MQGDAEKNHKKMPGKSKGRLVLGQLKQRPAPDRHDLNCLFPCYCDGKHPELQRRQDISEQKKHEHENIRW